MAEGCKGTREELEEPGPAPGCCASCRTTQLRLQSGSTLLAWGSKASLAGFLRAPGCNSLEPSCAAHRALALALFTLLLALDSLWLTQIEIRAGAQEKDPKWRPYNACSFPLARPQQLGHLALPTWWSCQLPPSAPNSDHTVLEFLGSTGPPSESGSSVLAKPCQHFPRSVSREQARVSPAL